MKFTDVFFWIALFVVGSLIASWIFNSGVGVSDVSYKITDNIKTSQAQAQVESDKNFIEIKARFDCFQNVQIVKIGGYNKKEMCEWECGLIKNYYQDYKCDKNGNLICSCYTYK